MNPSTLRPFPISVVAMGPLTGPGSQGDEAPAYHRNLAAFTEALDGVYAIGPLMRNLYDALPPAMQLGYTEDPAQFNAQSFAHMLHAGDTVTLKGSKKMLHVPGIPAQLAAALQK